VYGVDPDKKRLVRRTDQGRAGLEVVSGIAI
jgi:hypothetical protein